MSGEQLVSHEALSAGWHEFRYPRPAVDEPSAAFKRGLAAAVEVLRAQWEAEQLERMAAEVHDISNARHIYVQRSVDRFVDRNYGNVSEDEITKRYQQGVDRWNEDHPALLALWRRYTTLVEASKTNGE